MFGLHLLRPFEIGDGPGGLQESEKTAGGQPGTVQGREEILRTRIEVETFLRLFGAHFGIGLQAVFFEPGSLRFAGPLHALPDDRILRGLFLAAPQFPDVHPRNLDLEVDAVKHRAGYLLLVTDDFVRGAPTFLLRVAVESAGAGIHRGDQREFGRKGQRAPGAGDVDHARFERLAHGLPKVLLEFGKFVQEQHSPMGEAYLSRFGHGAPADHRNGSGGVVRGTERTAAYEAARRKARGAIDSGDLHRFRELEVWRHAGPGLRQHAFAHSRWAEHKQVVASRRGDRERPLGALLAFDLGEIHALSALWNKPSEDRGRNARAVLEFRDRLIQIADRHHPQVRDGRSFRSVLDRQVQGVEPFLRGELGDVQGAGYRTEFAVQCQLAQEYPAP